jgi:type I restriction enzyme S subunit
MKGALRPNKSAETKASVPISFTAKPELPGSARPKRASEEFVEALIIGQLTRLHSTPEHPLGRKRYQKLAYLSHRKADDNVQLRFLKKAAGPYSPWARYRGPESIALKSGYVKRAKFGDFEGLVVGDKISQIDLYVSRYPVCGAVNWASDNFRFRSNDDLELLTTVDFAVLDLKLSNAAVTPDSVRHIIATNKEWSAKLKREVFSDTNIARALKELQQTFPATYGP